MSHFTVMVIGNNPELQLEPYDENTEMAPYVDEGFDLEKALQRIRDWLVDPENTKADKKMAKLAKIPLEQLTMAQKLVLADAWDGGDLRIEVVGGVEKIVRYSTYNPDSKWDWYSLGGRWSGFFQLKPGAAGAPVETHWSETLNGETPSDKTGRTDQALKGDIDWEYMRTQAKIEALQTFQAMEERTKGLTPPDRPFIEVAEEILRAFDPEGGKTAMVATEDARKDAQADYLQHPWVKAAIGEKSYWFEDPYETFFQSADDPKEAFIQKAMASAVSTYAVLHDGEWMGRGEMGWFGIGHNETDEVAFALKQWELIESLPDDTLISMYDLHI